MHQYFGTGSQALQVAQYCMPDYKAYKAHPEDINLSVSAGVEEHHDELIVRAANRQVLRQTTFFKLLSVSRAVLQTVGCGGILRLAQGATREGLNILQVMRSCNQLHRPQSREANEGPQLSSTRP